MNAARSNTDFGTKTEFTTVAELRGRIPQGDGAVACREKMHGGRCIFRDDGFGVGAAEAGDVRQSGVDVFDDGDGNDGIQPLGGEISLRRRREGFSTMRRAASSARMAQPASVRSATIDGSRPGAMAASMSSVSVAPQDAGAPHLGIEQNAPRHGRVCGGVYVSVAQALGVCEHRHAGFSLHAFDQGFSAARNDQVDLAGGGQHGGDVAAVGGGCDLHQGFRASRRCAVLR